MPKVGKLLLLEQKDMEDLKGQAEKEGTSVNAIMRRFIKEGLRKLKKAKNNEYDGFI